jgi:hypothetical protein
MSSRKTKCALALAFIVLSACAEQQPQPMIQALQSGDGALTCEQIASQVHQLDQVAYGSPVITEGMRLADAAAGVQTVANTTTALTGIGFLSAVPMVNGVMTAASALARNAFFAGAQQQANTAAMAHERTQYLTGLYQEKHCAATEISQAGSRTRETALSENDQP